MVSLSFKAFLGLVGLALFNQPTFSQARILQEEAVDEERGPFADDTCDNPEAVDLGVVPDGNSIECACGETCTGSCEVCNVCEPDTCSTVDDISGIIPSGDSLNVSCGESGLLVCMADASTPSNDTCDRYV